MSIEYDMSKFPHSRGVQCGVLLERKLNLNLDRIAFVYRSERPYRTESHSRVQSGRRIARQRRVRP